MSKKSDQKECPSCAMMINKDYNICPICNYEFPEQSNYIKITSIILILFLIIFFLFII